MIKGAAFEQAACLVLGARGVDQPVCGEADRGPCDVVAHLVAFERDPEAPPIPQLHERQHDDMRGGRTLVGREPLVQRRIARQHLAQVPGGCEVRDQLGIGRIIGASQFQGRRQAVDESDYVFDGMDHGRTQFLPVAGQRAQARIGPVHRALDPAFDQFIRKG